ncbi:MAG: ECF transporter S component [Oscillospiraceae bacterium]|nr:ECF transporter S component [Oscillospiraceae bacterium]
MAEAKSNKSNVTKLVVTAMLSAVAVALQYIEVSIPLVPSFLKLDFSDIPELIGAFVIGPVGGVIICLIKNLIHLPLTSSVGVGEFSNFLLGAVFAFTAGIIYKRNKTKTTALIACLTASMAMAVISVVSNYFVVYPVYAQLWAGGDMEIIINMYKALLPASDNLIKSLLIFNVPFTFIKGLICSLATMIIYKPLSNLFVKLNSAINRNKNSSN